MGLEFQESLSTWRERGATDLSLQIASITFTVKGFFFTSLKKYKIKRTSLKPPWNCKNSQGIRMQINSFNLWGTLLLQKSRFSGCRILKCVWQQPFKKDNTSVFLTVPFKNYWFSKTLHNNFKGNKLHAYFEQHEAHMPGICKWNLGAAGFPKLMTSPLTGSTGSNIQAPLTVGVLGKCGVAPRSLQLVVQISS